MTRRVWVVVAHVVAWSLLVTGVTVLFLRHQDRQDAEPARAEPATYASMPFASTLSLDGSDRGRVGSVFRFSVEGFSDAGVAAVTLYDGARAMDTVSPDDAGRIAVSLPALSVGRHTVHAAVTDKDGVVSASAPMSVLVGQAPGEQDVPVEVPVEPDETLADVAERIGVPATDLLVGSRAIKPTQQVPVDVGVFAMVPPDAGVELLAGNDAVITPGPAVGGFALAGTASGCDVALAASGADDDVTFFRGGASTAGWIQLGRPQADAETEVADLSPGTHVFFARSGGMSSSQVSVTVPDRCADSFGWTGDASIVDGQLILPKAANGVFVHLSVDGQTWRRVPASQDELISAGVRTSIAHLLPSLAGRRLEVRVFQMNRDVPMPLASGALRLPSDRTIASVVGEPSAVDLSVDSPEGPRSGIQLESRDKRVDFTWNGASTATTRVRWQVLTSASGASSLGLSPPGLLASGVSEASGTGSLGGRSGTFTIDTADLPRADRQEPGAGSGGATTAVALKPPSPIGTLSDRPAFGAVVPVADLDGVVPAVELPVEGSTVYVRVVTEVGPAAASPSVFMVLPRHQSAGTGVDYDVNTVKVDAGRAPNPELVGCLKVVVPWGPGGVTDPMSPTGGAGGGPGVPTADAFQRYVASQFYKTSGVYCPGAFPPAKGCDAWYCEVVDFVVDAAGAVVGVVVQLYSLVVYAYNGVISTVVDVLTELNPICAALGAADAGDAASACKTVTGFATQAAISAVLASVGLPPSLPSAEELEAIASGELDRLAVELMKNLGVPCDAVTPPAGFEDALAVAGEQLDSPVLAAAADPCLAVAQLLIGSVREAATSSGQQALADASGLPSFPTVEDLVMTPDPRGQADPLQVEVSLTARDTDADTAGVTCLVQVHDPNRPGIRSVGPYPPFVIALKPTNSSGRTLKGRGAAYPSLHGTTVAELQGASYEVGVRRSHPSTCSFADTVETVTLSPAAP